MSEKNKIQLENIPEDLKQWPQWVCWQIELDEKGEQTKVPYDPKTLKKAKSNNPETWATFSEAVANLDKTDGIGFVVTDKDPFTGIDFDDCRDPEKGVIEQWVADIIKAVPTYWEVSPSGCGIRGFCISKLPEGRRRKGSIEVYDNGRYLTLTGNALNGSDINEYDGVKLHELLFGKQPPEETEQPPSNKPQILKDDELLQKMFSAKNGAAVKRLWEGDTSSYPSASEADMALAAHLWFWTGSKEGVDRLFRQSALYRDKWDKKHYGDGRTYGAGVLDAACTGETYKQKNNEDNVAKEDYSAPSQERNKKPTQTEVLLSIAKQLFTLFHDQQNEPFCFYSNQNLPLKSSKLKDVLSYKYYERTGKAPNGDSISQTINVLTGLARFDSRGIELHNRVAVDNGNIFYDMGNGVIEISQDTWKYMSDVPILFRRYSHQKQQVMPTPKGNVWDIFKFLNVHKDNQLLVLIYLVSCLIPNIPHPIFHPHGAQGSGKTTCCRILKEIIDPSSLSTLIMQRDYSQLIQAISHHYFVPFDNLSDLPGWASDILAIACTGGGLSKRQLYTDEEDVVLSVRRCIGLNAINLLISRADLMDRAILLHLERISPNNRKEESQLLKEFEAAKPSILGGLFDVLSAAMAIYPNLSLDRLPRMADFAKWGYAIGDALRHGGGNEFLRDYQKNIKRQGEEIIQSNTLILAVMKEMNQMYQNSNWEGTVKDIYLRLKEIAQPEKDDKSFPKTERLLRRHLERAKTTLIQQGIQFSFGERTPDGIPLTFKHSDFHEDADFGTFGTFTASPLPQSEPDVSNEANLGSLRKLEYDDDDWVEVP